MSGSSRKRGARKPDDPRHPVIQRILQVTQWTSEAQLCRELGVEQTTLSRRLGRGAGLPGLWVKAVAWRFGVRLEWLLRGRGPIYEAIRPVESYGRGADIALGRYRNLTPQQRQLLIWITDLIPYFELDLRRWCEEHQELLEARRGTRGYLIAASPNAEEEDFEGIEDDDDDLCTPSP